MRGFIARGGLGLASTPGGTTPGGGSGINFDAGLSGSGTFSDGQSVTITKSGGGFGTKSGGGKPKRWYPFESSLQCDTNFSRDTGNMTINARCSLSTTSPPVNGTHSAKVTMSEGNMCPFDDSPIWTFESTNKLYVYVERKHDHNDDNGSGGALNDKTIRVWPLAGSVAGLPDGYLSIGDNLALAFFEQTSDEVFLNGTSWQAMAFNSGGPGPWLTCEHLFREESAVGANDGVWTHLRNGVSAYTYSRLWDTRSGSTTQQSVYLDEVSNGAPTGQIYFHSLYVDDSWARVFISSESSYNTSTSTATQFIRSICLPTSWSNTSITVTLRKGQFTSLTGKYLWALTDSNTAIRIGQFT